MVVVQLEELSGQKSPLREFLRSKLGVQVRIRGDLVEIDGKSAKEVKLLVHKFLHQQGLAGYRVLSNAGILEIVPAGKQGPKTSSGKTKEMPPFPPLAPTMLPGLSTVYPNYLAGGIRRCRKTRT